MEAVQQMRLAEKLMQTMSDSIVIDQGEVRRTFDRSPDTYDEFELAHIFLSADAPREGKGGDQEALIHARKAQAALVAGTPFERVAESSSDDRQSAVEGGVLPTVLGANIQPVFLAALRTMKNGDVSGIVKGDQGYHIIKLLRRTHAFNGPSRDMIERQIKGREMQKLRKRCSVGTLLRAA